MAAGLRRCARYPGTAPAVALQRLVDDGAVTSRRSVEMPEQLMTPLPLVEWISNNRKIDPDSDDRPSARGGRRGQTLTAIDWASMARAIGPSQLRGTTSPPLPGEERRQSLLVSTVYSGRSRHTDLKPIVESAGTVIDVTGPRRRSPLRAAEPPPGLPGISMTRVQPKPGPPGFPI